MGADFDEEVRRRIRQQLANLVTLKHMIDAVSKSDVPVAVLDALRQLAVIVDSSIELLGETYTDLFTTVE